MKCPYCGAEVNINVSSVCEWCDSDLSHIINQFDFSRTTEPAQEDDRPLIYISVFNRENGRYESEEYHPPEKTEGKKRSEAAILCILGFCGIHGLHRIYTGKILSGLLYFFTFGGFYIGTIIDLILILTDNFKDKNGNELN